MTDITKVAIIDDDPAEAETIGFAIQDAGFEPVVFEKDHYEEPTDLAKVILSRAQGAICDHRLSDMAFAQFDGASLVASLYEQKLPAVLITQFINMDADVSIRRWRHRIPVLLKRSEADSESLKEALSACSREINGEQLPGRVPRRTLIRIVTVNNEVGGTVFDAIIPAWNAYEAVRFPASLLPTNWVASLARNDRLFARVNIGAERSDELFFYDFEMALAPDENDGLT